MLRFLNTIDCGEDAPHLARNPFSAVRRFFRVVACGLVVFALSCPAAGQTGDEFGEPEPEQRLGETVRIAWSGQSLRDGLQALQRDHGIAIFLDRRIDPGQNLSLDMQDVKLRDVLEAIAVKQQLGLTWLGPVAYFGPRETARDLRTLAELRRQGIRKLPMEARKKLVRPNALVWDELAMPRELLRKVSDRYGVSIDNIDRIPHDLWPAGALPPLAMADQLTLLSVGFGMTFRLEAAGGRAQLVPMPKAIVMDRVYPADGQDPEEFAKTLKRVAQDALVKVYQGQVAVRGRIEDHERIEALRRGDPVAIRRVTPPNGTPRPEVVKVRTYTLTATAPLGQLLSALARQAKFQLKLDRKAISQAKIDMQQVVKVDVKEVTLDELLEASLRPAGLQHRRDGTTVHVAPGP